MMARWLYALALALCSRDLRDRHADDMRVTFDALYRDARSRGRLAAARLVASEVIDVLTAARSRTPRPSPPAVSKPLFRRSAVHGLWQGVRFAFRMLRRQPGFALVAIVTLALGIGANTAVFTVVNGVLLRPLPYQDPDRLVLLMNGRSGRLSLSFSPPNYRDVTAQTGVFSEWAAISPSAASLTGTGDPVHLAGGSVTPRFFSVLGVAPRYGRAFVDGDATAGTSQVVILSDGLWRRQFGGRPDAIGSTVRMDGKPFAIVGVAPAGVNIPSQAEYWTPLVFTPENLSDGQRGAQWIGVLARLKPGVTLEQAQSAIAAVAERLARDCPRTNKGRVMSATRVHDRIVHNIRPALLILLGAVTLVLLVACVNVANLLLARANSRTREVAVRAAVGAARARLVQQFLAESLVLGLAGGTAGLAVAFWSTRALVSLGPASIPRLAEVAVDWRVLAFTLAVAVITSVVFGLVPALSSTATTIAQFISTAGRGSVGHARTGLRKACSQGFSARSLRDARSPRCCSASARVIRPRLARLPPYC